MGKKRYFPIFCSEEPLKSTFPGLGRFNILKKGMAIGRIIKKQYILLEYTSGSNGICKWIIWRRKLIEMACEYTELLNPRWHMIRLYVLQLLLHQWFQIEKVYLYNVLIIWNLLLKMQVLKKRGLGARVVMFNASHGQTLSHNVVSSTPRLSGIRAHNVSGERRWLTMRLRKRGRPLSWIS